MRSLFFSLSLAILIICTFGTPVFALPDGATKPLMIIRFDENPVNYSKNLDKAVKMALDKKPSVSFGLVAITPETENKDINKQKEKDAKFFAEQVAERIKQSGVSPDMINISSQHNNLYTINEIQIFVQ